MDIYHHDVAKRQGKYPLPASDTEVSCSEVNRKDIRSLTSQSEHGFNAIYCFSSY